MESLESLNDLAEEFSIKPFILTVFHLKEMHTIGKRFQRLPSRPKSPPCSDSYNLIFDLGNESFCSIFSAAPESIKAQELNTVSIENQGEKKLLSDQEILSSEFECDDLPPILTSEVTNQEGFW